jgi:signal transduction histidine kinase
MPSEMAVRLRDFVFRWRWLIAGVAALFTIAVELFEHRPSGLGDLDTAIIREILIFGALGPLLLGGIFSVLARTWSERRTAVLSVGQLRELSLQLAQIQDWDELTAFIAQYAHGLVPMLGSGLYVYDQLDDAYKLAAEWWASGLEPVPVPALQRAPGLCGACARGHLTSAGYPLPLRCVDNLHMPGYGNRYCLPLMRGSLPIAFLYLYFSPDVILSVEEMNLLGGMAAPMVVAIHGAQPQRSAAIQAEATELERQRIARDLHDTLGQSLAYLHLKLDQLTGDDTLREIGAIRQELERMRDVANDSYQKVRETLNDLRSGDVPDLAAALLQSARSAGSMAGFEADLVVDGQPRPLSVPVQRHILSIFGAALANVGKHTEAGSVRLHLTWTDDALTIRLVDSGHGFDVHAAHSNGHYGLAIMRERAQEIGGQVEIVSSPGSGTAVIFSLPFASVV